MLGESAARQLTDRLQDPRASGTDPFSFELASGATLEATWHRVDALVIVELEPTISDGGALMPLLFTDVRHAVQALQSTDSVHALCDAVAREIGQLTGHDRVMVYRFHPDGHGEVVAEHKAPHQKALLGLHHPTIDIPLQARGFHVLDHLRVIADVGHQPVPLLTAPSTDAAAVTPLNLSLSALRSVSPRLEFLTGGAPVGATLTVSLVHGTRLWGMLACHLDSPRRVDAQRRAACRVLGQVFSLQIAAHETRERHASRARLAEIETKLLARMSGAASLVDALVGHDPSPLLLADADGMVARIDGRTSTSGSVPPPHVVDVLIARLREPEQPRAVVCDDLPHRYGGAFGAFASQAAGVLAVPLTAAFEDFIVWFRGERVVDQVGAGDPTESKPTQDSTATSTRQPSPRSSFGARATQVSGGRSRPWVRAEVDTAFSLAGAVPELLLAQARDRPSHLALHDPLTALPNRGLLLDRGAQALSVRERGGRPVTMIYIDLDRFKLVNDSLGHSAGDDLLVQASGRLLAAVRDIDTVARMDGDEFVVMCQGPSLSEIEILSERLVEAFRTPFVLDGTEVLVTASLGVAVADEGATVGDLLRDADTAMYRAKDSGRNTAEPFTRAMRTTSLRRVEIETSLRPALEHGDFRLYFQPLFDTSCKLLGFEALTRWPLAGRGMVPPTEFIPVAEQAGLIGPLTHWVLDVGLHQLSQWRDRRPDLDLTLAVNITASQMTNADVQHSIDLMLNRTQLPPAVLCLEIGEGALVTDDSTSRAFLQHVRGQGVQLSIDDFGTGYSSLSYLTKLPVHELKIDRAFVAELPGHHSDMRVVASVVALAHHLSLRAVAEGVETQEQFDALRRLGCDVVQGYLLAKPMPAHEIDRYLDGIGLPIVEQTRASAARGATTRAP